MLENRKANGGSPNDKLPRENLLLGPEVRHALENGLPVVALESTIISHGMPYPQNLETAVGCEAVIRENGAVPATCAILGGTPCVGLDMAQLERLARGGQNAVKTSRRDFPLVLARGLDGATTVAGTMILAAMAGIRVFATGGIGGVHRGAETTMDISADLEELGRTPMTVVCAGPKSILSLPLTMEYLETKGVPVIGYKTDELPAFYTSRSGIPLRWRADSADELAMALRAHAQLGLQSGMLVVNPIPEDCSMEPARINAAVEEALAQAGAQGVSGKDVTPFLLSKVAELTGGDSLAANIRLVTNNAALAAQIAARV